MSEAKKMRPTGGEPMMRTLMAALCAVGLLAGCATTGPQAKSEGGARRPGGSSAGTAGGGKQGAPAQPKPEDLVSSKSLRLFEDANKSFEEQKKVRVYDWPGLERKYKAVVDADERFAEAWYNLGVIYERQRRFDDARKAYKEALSQKPLKAAMENLAVMLENEGKPQDALEMYDEILRWWPHDGAARARKAALYHDTGDIDRALRMAREALAREPQNLTAYKVLMRIYLERNNLNMAKLVALRAVKIDPNDPELYYTQGLILLKEKDELAAAGQFRKALQERDDYLAARVQLAEMAVKNRDWTTAAEQYRKVLQYDGKNLAAKVNLGVAYKGLGEFDKAMAEYDGAIKADGDSPEPYFNMGVIFQQHKDAPEKALEYYKKFIATARGNLPADHPVFENVRQCEQAIRATAEAKAEAERAKAQAKLDEERAKKDAADQKRLEDAKKKEESDKAKAHDDAKRAQDKERRQKEAKQAVDAALSDEPPPAPKAAQAPAPAPKKPEPARDEPKPAPKAGADDEPTDGL